MARNASSRGRLGVVVTVLVLGGLAGVAIWQSLQQSTNPDYQIRTERTGVGEYYVNLWSDPFPMSTGDVELSTQLTTIIGSPIELSYLQLDVVPPDDSEPEQLGTERTQGGPNDGDLFVANTSIDRTGTWQVVVRYSFGGPEVSETFTIEVSE
jgi:hypothetical protein